MWGQCFIEKFCYFLPYSVMVFYYEQRFGRMSYFMNLVIGASQLQAPKDAHAEITASVAAQATSRS